MLQEIIFCRYDRIVTFGAVCTQTLRSFTPVLDHTTLERPIIYNKRNLHARVSSVYLY